MIDIPFYDTFSKVERITKGMSGDQKYYIETIDGKHLLLRIADISEYEQKKSEFERMQKMVGLGIPMSIPIDFGICNDGKDVYTLLSWIDGEEMENLLSSCSEMDQYNFGTTSGQIFRQIHSLPVLKGVDNWSTRYFAVMDERLEAFRAEGIHFKGDERILNYLDVHKHLLADRPQCCHHGDYHMGNLICSKDGSLSVIDWHTVDFNNYGDPWYEFNRIGVEFPAFASGQIDGYWGHNPPEQFWKLLAYYISASAITSIVWSKYFAPERLQSILKRNEDILRWFDNMKNPVPIWYHKDLYSCRPYC